MRIQRGGQCSTSRRRARRLGLNERRTCFATANPFRSSGAIARTTSMAGEILQDVLLGTARFVLSFTFRVSLQCTRG